MPCSRIVSGEPVYVKSGILLALNILRWHIRIPLLGQGGAPFELILGKLPEDLCQRPTILADILGFSATGKKALCIRHTFPVQAATNGLRTP